MKLTLVYPERLGDILQMLPCAYHLSLYGVEPEIHCKPQYHSLFECVPYCKPNTTGKTEHQLNLAIWPNQYEAYRISGVRWQDWVYGQFSLWCLQHGIPPLTDRQIRLAVPDDETLGRGYSIISPYGHSQITKWTASQLYAELTKREEPTLCYILSDKVGCDTAYPTWTARNIPELVSAIAHADHVITINSAPTYIASATRLIYYHVIQKDFNLQDDFWHPTQIRLAI